MFLFHQCSVANYMCIHVFVWFRGNLQELLVILGVKLFIWYLEMHIYYCSSTCTDYKYYSNIQTPQHCVTPFCLTHWTVRLYTLYNCTHWRRVKNICPRLQTLKTWILFWIHIVDRILTKCIRMYLCIVEYDHLCCMYIYSQFKYL